MKASISRIVMKNQPDHWTDKQIISEDFTTTFIDVDDHYDGLRLFTKTVDEAARLGVVICDAIRGMK